MSLGLRRFFLVVLSIALGVGGLFATLAVLDLVWAARATLERYGTVFAVTTAIPIGLLAAVWLDALLGTGILPDGMVAEEE